MHKRYFLFLVWDSGKAWLGLADVQLATKLGRLVQ
jgi:hypothetical protein